MSAVLLLGASSDMATAIARKFAQDKFDILLAGRNVQQLSELKTDLEIRYKVKAEVVKFDALDFANHESFYKNLPFHPDITICVFGYLGDQQKARDEQDAPAPVKFVARPPAEFPANRERQEKHGEIDREPRLDRRGGEATAAE